jgi:methylthioribose-1-phosphate isomerase
MYVAVPSSTIDWTLADGGRMPIEERDAGEVLHDGGGEPVAPPGTTVMNPAFDVTPARLVTGLITERGICRASTESLAAMFPERRT